MALEIQMYGYYQPESELRGGQWVMGQIKWVNRYGRVTWVVGHTCDPLIHDPLTDDEPNQISITFGIRPIKRVTFYCDSHTFCDIQFVAWCMRVWSENRLCLG